MGREGKGSEGLQELAENMSQGIYEASDGRVSPSTVSKLVS